jgi:tetratricopeptide (TPR) repeat protein
MRVSRILFSPIRVALVVAACGLPAAALAVVSNPVSTPEEARAVASQLADSGSPAAAIAILQDEAAKHPTDTATRLQLARQLALSKRYAEANENYSAVLSREPQNLAAKVGLAKVASWQGDLDRSLALYEEVLARSPHLYDARVGKGFTLAWMGRNDEALTILRTAAKVHPEDQEVATEVARLAKLLHSEPATTSAPVSTSAQHKTRPREAAITEPVVSRPVPQSEYPRTFAEPIPPERALAPEPRPWIPIGAFAGVILALSSITFAVRKRMPVMDVPATLPGAVESPTVAPQEPVAAVVQPEPAPAPEPAAATRVLLVEPNDDAAEFVRMVLTQHGARVERLATVHEVLAHTQPVDLVIIGESCTPARAEELVQIAERAGSALVFACNTTEEAQVIHAAGGQSIRRPFRIMDLFSLLAATETAAHQTDAPIDAHTWKPSQAEAASCERPFHSPPRPLQ